MSKRTLHDKMQTTYANQNSYIHLVKGKSGRFSLALQAGSRLDDRM